MKTKHWPSRLCKSKVDQTGLTFSVSSIYICNT